MLPDDWRALAPLVDAVLDAPVELRVAALDEASAGDPARRAALERLVAECERDVPILNRPAAERFARLLAGDEPEIPETLGGRYRIGRELGRGGMACVYLAHDTKHGRDVAVKVIRPDLAASLGRDRFLREIGIAARLRHPNIVPVYDSGDADGLLYYVMPFEEGESLRARISGERRLPVAECVSALRDVARALAYAHEHGVVHRDVKPDNVMMSGGAAVVTDFGIAKAVSAAQTEAAGGTITQAGAGIGTPAYMAPEQAIGDPSTDHRADIYAFGCLAYELFARHPPFHGQPTHQIIAAHVGTKPVPLSELAPGVPDSVARLVARCLEKHPAARPQSAHELVAELEGTQTTPNERRRRHRGLLASLVVTGVLVLGLTGYLVARALSPTGDRPIGSLTLAVLPLRPLGGDSTQSDMADGLSDEVATSLFAVPGVRVMSRGAVGRYRGLRDIDPQKVGQALGARLLVMGSLRGTGSRFTVTVNLVDAQDGTNLWGAVLERSDGDFTAAREDIVRAIEQRLRTRFGTPTRVPAESRASARTVNHEADRYYYLGQGALSRRGQNVRTSVEWFRRAAQIDTLHAPAYSGLSLALAITPFFQMVSTREVAAEATAAAERALRLDSTLAQPHVALGLIYQHANDWDRAFSEFQAALRLRSEDDVEPLLHYGRHLLFRGRLDEGLAQLLEARRHEPASALVSSWVAYAYYVKRELDSALVENARAFQADSTNITTLSLGSVIQLRAGQTEKAREFVTRIRIPVPGLRYYVLAAIGDTAALRKRWADLERLGPNVWMSEWGRAMMFLGLRDTTQAMAALERATDAFENWPANISAVSDPVYDPIQGSARYQKLLRRVGLGDRGPGSPPSR
jgi:serine/threonine-protein kinase